MIIQQLKTISWIAKEDRPKDRKRECEREEKKEIGSERQSRMLCLQEADKSEHFRVSSYFVWPGLGAMRSMTL